MKCVVLMGFMGAGKTTVGKELAKLLSCELIDTDAWIEKEQGRKISDIFAESGEQAFRDMETELLKQLCVREERYILSLGGGMPVRMENRGLLQKIGQIVYLKTSKEEIIRRVSGNADRPLLQTENPKEELEKKVTALMEAREEIYLSLAEKIVVTDGKRVDEVVKEIQGCLQGQGV